MAINLFIAIFVHLLVLIMNRINEQYLRQLELSAEQLVRLNQQQANHIRTLQLREKELKARIKQLESTVHEQEKKLSIAMIACKSPNAVEHIQQLQNKVKSMAKTVDQCIDFLKKEV